MRIGISVAIPLFLFGCSLITIKQDPFPTMDVQAERPPPKPARVVLTKSSIQIGEKVQFEVGSAEILPASFPLLDEVAQVLSENLQIELLHVEGHTDSTGSSRGNKKLSKSARNTME